MGLFRQFFQQVRRPLTPEEVQLVHDTLPELALYQSNHGDIPDSVFAGLNYPKDRHPVTGDPVERLSTSLHLGRGQSIGHEAKVRQRQAAVQEHHDKQQRKHEAAVQRREDLILEGKLCEVLAIEAAALRLATPPRGDDLVGKSVLMHWPPHDAGQLRKHPTPFAPQFWFPAVVLGFGVTKANEGKWWSDKRKRNQHVIEYVDEGGGQDATTETVNLDTGSVKFLMQSDARPSLSDVQYEDLMKVNAPLLKVRRECSL